MSNPTLPSPTPTAVTPWQNPPTLAQIQNKVRRLTRTPSTAQLTDQDLNNYINTFIVYDFPETLRTFNLRTEFTFWTTPGQDVYPTDITSFAGCTTNPLYNFQNLYISIHAPIYIAGYQAYFVQDRTQFFTVYPFVNSIAFTGSTGNAATTTFTGIVNSQQSLVPAGATQQISLLQRNVLFDSIDANGNGLALVDVPVVNPATGANGLFGNLYDPNSVAYQAALNNPPTTVLANNNINYLTGNYTITFTTPPGAGIPINSQTVPQNIGLPQGLLYHNNEFTVRPVPNQPYAVNFEVYSRPTALMSTSQVPELEEYWQYIAYGSAKKIFEDRMDMDSVQLIMPEFKKQEALVLRRTIVQLTNERTATIYTENTAGGYGPGWSQGGGNF